MPDPTSRLKLENPEKGAFDWENSWWGNTSKIDNHPGIMVCTSSNRPIDPWTGQVIYETDTGKLLVFDSVAWQTVFAPAP